MKRILLILFAVGLVIVQARCQSDGVIHVKAFGQTTVGGDIAAAQATCPTGTASKCYLVIDASLANFPVGTIPSLCGSCILVDYRTTWPGAGGGGGGVPAGATNQIQKNAGSGAFGASACNDNGIVFICSDPLEGPALYAGSPTLAAVDALPPGANGISDDMSATPAVPTANVCYLRAASTAGQYVESCNGTAENTLMPTNAIEIGGSPLTLTAYSGAYWNNTSGAYSFLLPTPPAAPAILQLCFGDYGARSGVLSIIPPSGVTIYYKGAAGTAGSSTGLVSAGVGGDFLCVVSTSATTYQATGPGSNNDWTNH